MEPRNCFTGDSPLPKGLLEQAFFATEPQVQESDEPTGGAEIWGLGRGQAQRDRPVPQERVVLIEIDVEPFPVQEPVSHLRDGAVGYYRLPDGLDSGPKFIA